MEFLCPKLCWLLAGVLLYGLCSTCRTGRQVILIIGVALHLRYFIDIYREFLDLWLTENLTTIQSLNNSPFADVALIKILPILSFR